MTYRYEHYMSISHIALIANMVHRDPNGVFKEIEEYKKTKTKKNSTYLIFLNIFLVN